MDITRRWKSPHLCQDVEKFEHRTIGDAEIETTAIYANALGEEQGYIAERVGVDRKT